MSDVHRPVGAGDASEDTWELYKMKEMTVLRTLVHVLSMCYRLSGHF